MSDPTAYQTPVDIPVCPRHPDRESHVRCQRCSRPVCPECQRPAAVGIQCVDCVRESAREVRPTRTVFGGLVATGGRPGQATLVIMGLCVAVYIVEKLQPSVLTAMYFSPYAGWGEPWRAVTAAFLHSPSTILHIVFNMLCLWQIGPYLESLLGRVRFILLYFVSAIGGSAGVLLLAAPPPAATSPSVAVAVAPGWFTPVVGASGAVFGLFGALLVLNRHLGRSTAGIGITILINAAFSFFFPGISWQAHLGGFLTGLACAGVIAASTSPSRHRYAVPGLLGVLAVVVALSLVKYGTVVDFYR